MFILLTQLMKTNLDLVVEQVGFIFCQLRWYASF